MTGVPQSVTQTLDPETVVLTGGRGPWWCHVRPLPGPTFPMDSPHALRLTLGVGGTYWNYATGRVSPVTRWVDEWKGILLTNFQGKILPGLPVPVPRPGSTFIVDPSDGPVDLTPSPRHKCLANSPRSVDHEETGEFPPVMLAVTYLPLSLRGIHGVSPSVSVFHTP